MQIRNPRTGKIDYILKVDAAEEILSKSDHLRAHQKNWLDSGIEHRISTLLQFHTQLSNHLNDLSGALSIDTGRRQITQLEIQGALGVIQGRCFSVKQYYDHAEARPSVTNPTVKIVQQRIPYQLVGVISPWNFPLLLALIDTIPALLAGSAVLLKPSEVTPRFIDVLERCISLTPGLSNVLSVIRGSAEAGKSVVSTSDVVCFTGSVETGKKIAAQCAERFIPAFLELGGKDPAIVLPDANLDIATDAIIRSCAGATGQACQSLERVYVHRDIYDDFLDLLKDKVSLLSDNSNYDKGGVIGPLIFKKQADKIQAQLEDAVKKGATIISGGNIKNINGGLWLLPTIVVDIDHTMSIMSEETFGPVIPLMKFDTIEEAVRLANDSQFGLSASVFSSDIKMARHVASQIEAGGISINDASLTNQVFDAEKNSFKSSGLYGSRMGADGFLRFFRKKALLIQEGRASDIYVQAEKLSQ